MSANLNTSAKVETTAGAARFPLGQTLITPSAQEAIREAGQLPLEFLLKHQAGDWGKSAKRTSARMNYRSKKASDS
jgi:hypothetical protein